MFDSFDYAKYRGGIESGSAYPYTGEYNGCSVHSGPFTVNSYFIIQRSCAALYDALLIQPVSVAVDASRWSNMIDDIFPYKKTSQINHAVLLTGFTS